jgi:hypothetical protein
MFKNRERYIELYNHIGTHFEIVADTLWMEYNRMIVPVGPAKYKYSLSKDESEYLLVECKMKVDRSFTCKNDRKNSQ